jgi:hypothetical protein
MVQDAVAANLPPFLSLDSVEIEAVPIGPETVKVNFKAIVLPKEDLYQVDREVEGSPKVTLLKLVQSAGTKVSLYGSIAAHRIMDQWTLDSQPKFEVGLEQFGTVRGAFSAGSYVTGSDEANAALKEQVANAALQEQAKKAALEQQEIERKAALEQQEIEQKSQDERQAREEKIRREREEQARIAFEEQQKKLTEQREKEAEQQKAEEDAANQKLILATIPGTRYIGTIKTQKDTIQRIQLIFTEQKDLVIGAEADNPDNPKEKRTFIGELRFTPKPEEDGSPGYSIVMSPVGKGTKYIGINADLIEGFYDATWGDGDALQLRLTDKGMEGEALKNRADLSSGNGLIICLQGETSRSSASPTAAPATRPQPSAPIEYVLPNGEHRTWAPGDH